MMKKIPFILLAFVWTVANGQRPLRSSVPDGYIFVAAHRADWKYAPENSLQALRNAIFFGADIIETD
ncbi:MAG: glycerophosphodiester phosphodiesterase, partial [Prevotella sp.]|nr:glycerophosphodiester phosphodiesterase [Prevotella sp.]